MAKRSLPQVPLGMVLMRVVTGLIMLAHGWRWLKAGDFDGQVVVDAVSVVASTDSGLAAWWAEHVVLANPDASAFIWRWCALAAGLSFVLGAFTRLAGLIAVFLLLHTYALTVDGATVEWLLLTTSCIACATAGAGRRVGFDAMFDANFPTWLTLAKRADSGFLS